MGLCWCGQNPNAYPEVLSVVRFHEQLDRGQLAVRYLESALSDGA